MFDGAGAAVRRRRAAPMPEPSDRQRPLISALGFGLAALFGADGLSGTRPLGTAADRAAVERDGGVRADRHPDRALLPHRRLRPLDPVRRRSRSLLAALYALRHRGCSASATTRPGIAAAGAIFATGAMASLALALTFALEKGWLTVALALMVPGIAWVAGQAAAAALRWLAAGVIASWCCCASATSRASSATTSARRRSSTGCSTATACRRHRFWYAGHTAAAPRRRRAGAHGRRRGHPVHRAARLPRDPSLHDQRRPLRASRPLTETALQVSRRAGDDDRARAPAPAERQRGPRYRRADRRGADLGGNRVRPDPRATIRFITATGRRAVLQSRFCSATAFRRCSPACSRSSTRDKRPLAVPLRRGGGRGRVLRCSISRWKCARLYHGSTIAASTPPPRRRAIHLFGGLARLRRRAVDAGFLLRSQPARMASAAVVALTIGKVFLVDMADLTGIFRALSFIGLGAVLIGIALLYQRLLFPARRARHRRRDATKLRKSDGSACEAIRRGVARDAQVQ